MTHPSALAVHVEALSGSRVLCVGDLMLDRFVYGEVERISPEAPIPVIRITRETSMLGGAGNVVRNLVALGTRPLFLSARGEDIAGDEVARLIAQDTGLTARLVIEPERQTTVKTRYVAGGQQLLRADKETLAPLSVSGQRELVAAADEHLTEAAVMVLSDYGKGVLATETTQALIRLARSHGRPVIVDPKGRDYTPYRGAAVLTPNRRELAEATGMPVGNDEQVVAGARHLMDTCGVSAVLVTRSQDGMTLVTGSDSDSVHHLPAEAREVFDVSGAGDTVVATLAAALAAGVSLLDAAQLANAAAGVVVGKVGTAVIYPAELVTAWHHRELATTESKVLPLEAAVERVGLWQRRGLRVGFTNGCFDLLHPGHISLLSQARASCDRLIVGLNSDASVSRLKGPQRPVQSESARAVVLTSLATVDLVVIFGEETPLRLIEALRPDLLVKGADYSLDKVVGADLVMGYGGRVLLADLKAGFSTTATIARLGGARL
ncbi:MAG: D-glycero-beta-D-manno-heptose-7-phosphate kinase [Alphaproteobacteria bacterium]|nr:D-glycero-beta-D-manno-heptose-7-phosphate kinase [Alphaproteobacteria bacterium]